MKSPRRLALSLLCATSLAAGLAAASAFPAAAQSPQYGQTLCTATPFTLAGTYAGTFENNSGDTLAVTFTSPSSVSTQWTVQGWQGSGTGQFEFGPAGPEWTNSDIVTTGPVSGSDSELYKSVQVTCDVASGQVATISGVADAGQAQIPFTITRR